jgi:hypothetical protein
MGRIHKTLVGSVLLPVVAALSMSFLPPLCYRTGSFTACSQASDYEPVVTCPNPEGQPWTCNSAAPTKNDMVTRCVQANHGELGRKACQDHATSSGQCVYKKAKCGVAPGDCSLEAKDTEITVKEQYLTGGDCLGQ